MAMNIPAYTVPTSSRLGCTFDCHTSSSCTEIFPADISSKTEHVNKSIFKFKAVTSNAEVKELMNLPSDLPLRIKANLLSVEGPGKYFSDDLKVEEDKTEILAVMTCITVSKAAEYSAKPDEQLANRLGTHYVRKISYGGQMVASIKLNFSQTSVKPRLNGIVEGDMTSEATAVALSKQLDSIITECRDASNISVTYYTTDLPCQTGSTHNLEELMRLFRDFRSKTSSGEIKETPIEVELQQTGTLIPSARAYLPNMALTNALEEIESRFDDLRSAQYLVKNYRQDLDKKKRKFTQDLEKVCQTFIAAISTLDTSGNDNQFDDCFKAYEDALNGLDLEGKFTNFWRNLLSKKAILSTIQLPPGKKLTIAVIGKNGSGKSATANSIVGEQSFPTSAWATSAVSSELQFGSREEGRQIDVVEIPASLKPEAFQREVSGLLEWAPKGFDAIVLVARYGCRFTSEDAQALKSLQEYLGENAGKYIILVLTYGDQAEHAATEDKILHNLDGHVHRWLQTLPDWVQNFIQQIDNRVILFNNLLQPQSEPEAYKRQLSKLIQAIDDITEKTSPFLPTQLAKNDFKRNIKEASRNPKHADREGSSHGDSCYVPIAGEHEEPSRYERVRSFFDTRGCFRCTIL
ncbi:uncharacterized protein [Porites lutea]|uniref:uncharacterized protein n=1 Tax=Porites lutea TaxID=51062 RepID=UPI003CC600DD